MNNFNLIINNTYVQIFIILVIVWFFFIKEDFNQLPADESSCEKCKQFLYNKNNTTLSLNDFQNKCIKLEGEYKKENNNYVCLNFKSKLDSNYRCNCDIK
jgi:Tfp pilus assembly protein PilO